MLKVLFFAILIYLLFAAFIFFFQRKLIYFPDTETVSPVQAGVPDMQIVSLHTDDNLNLEAWYRKPKDPSRPTIIYFHGNAGNIGNRGLLMRPFLNAGLGVLLVTYRGYSGNPGKPSELGFYKDARAAIQFLLNKNVAEKCIVLYGESIGGSVALKMASEYNVGALILQSPFTSIADIGQFHYPIIPVKWLVWDRFDALSLAGKLEMPVLILYAEEDDIIPKEFSRQIFDAIKSKKQLVGFQDIGHNDLFNADSSIEFINKMKACP